MNPLRFGIVGCGAVVTLHHLPVLRRCQALQLVAVVDRDCDWAARVAAGARIPTTYDDHRGLIGQVDAALVATPNATHAEVASDLLEHGIHVLCEKPLTTTRAEAERMFAAARRGGARLMAAQSLRFNANITMLHEMVSTGWLGELQHITAGIGGPYESTARRTDFRRDPRLSGGGVLIDLGVHVIDVAVWLTGASPTSIDYASACVGDWAVENEAEANLHFAGGVTAEIMASFARPLGNAIEVRGTTGWALAPLYTPTELVFFTEEAAICRRAGMQTLRLDAVNMYAAQVAHFCEAVATETPFLVTPEQMLATLEVVDRCYARMAA